MSSSLAANTMAFLHGWRLRPVTLPRILVTLPRILVLLIGLSVDDRRAVVDREEFFAVFHEKFV